jgi:SnoaL-like domain
MKFMTTPEATTDMMRLPLLYARYADEGRSDDLVGLFDEDGVVDVGARVAKGREELTQFFGPGRPPKDGRQRTKHVITNILVTEESPERAALLSYFQVLTRNGLTSWGRYIDQVVRNPEGEWRIARRVVAVDGPVQESGSQANA